MPIAGFGEGMSVPRIGNVRMGIKTTNQQGGSAIPKATDHFVVKQDGSTSVEAARAFQDVYGDKPKVLDIMLPDDNPDVFFPQWLKRYGPVRSNYLCRGNGIEAKEYIPQKKTYQSIECKGKDCHWFQSKQCKATGSLSFFLPKVQGIGLWQIDTKGFYSIENLNNSINMLKNITGGRIAFLDLKLAIGPKYIASIGVSIQVLNLYFTAGKLEDLLKPRIDVVNGLVSNIEESEDCSDDQGYEVE